jgi:hypothetical protein
MSVALYDAKERPWFFVVRQHSTGPKFVLEYGDHRGTAREIQTGDAQRWQLPATLPDGRAYEPTLTELIDAYQRRVRLKPVPRSLPDRSA